MTFRYFSEYGKVLPLPEVKEPKAINFQITGQNDLLDLDGNSFTKRCNEYNEWLSSGIHVPDEHLWYFEGVDRDESEFETYDSNKWFLAKCEKCGWIGSSEKLLGGGQIADTGDYEDGYCPKCESKGIVDIGESYKGLVAIPKAEESKEQEDSPIEAVRDILNYIYAGGDSPYWMLKEVQMRLEKLITQ
jgi:hypothetical protein